MQLSCPSCSLDFERHPGSFIGGVGLNTVVSFVALIVAIIAAFVVIGEDGTLLELVLAPLAVAAIVPLAFYPFSKIIWVGIEYVIAPPDDDNEKPDREEPDSPRPGSPT